MNRTILRLLRITRITRSIAPLSIVLCLAGCASSDGASSEADGITPQEVAEGEAWAAPGSSEHADEHAAVAGEDLGAQSADLDPESGLALQAPEEDSAKFLDEDEARIPPEPVVPGVYDPDAVVQAATCRRATGYRSGKKFDICVTTIDGKLVEVNTARAYLRMRKAARTSGVSLYVVSGFRTMAKQRYLYGCYKSKRCNGGNLAAPPGYSNHQSGKALDLNTSARGVYSFLANRGRNYGFRRTVPSEAWHWEH